MKLNDIAEFVTDKISSSSISLDRYVTTDSLLQTEEVEKLHEIYLQCRVPLLIIGKVMY